MKLSNSSTKILNVFINATSSTLNSSFLLASQLDGSKHVVMDISTLRATKALASVYSLRDVAFFSKNNIMDAKWSVLALCYSIQSDLGSNATRRNALKEKKYKQMEADMQIIPISPNGSISILFSQQIPSFLVKALKSKTYFMEKAVGKATSEDILKA